MMNDNPNSKIENYKTYMNLTASDYKDEYTSK